MTIAKRAVHRDPAGKRRRPLLTRWQIPVLVCGCAALTGCSPPVERDAFETPPPLPVAAPPPTPHPAAGARARAIQLYPDLAVKGSVMNRTFLDIVQQHSANNPKLLAQADWPLNVAEHAAHLLGIAPVPETTPKPRVPSLLERGAYDQKRRVTKPPVFYDTQ